MSKKDSIFQLRKINPLQAGQVATATKVHTVNFYSRDDTNLAEQILGLGQYFDQKIEFLKASYEFAKVYRIKHGKVIDDNSDSKENLKSWLATHYPNIEMIEGTQFGVLITKVNESIKSIEKNQYITTLKENIKQKIYKYQNPEIDWETKENLKELPKLAKKVDPTLEDLQSIRTELKSVFKYDLILRAKNITDLLIQLQDKSYLSETQIIMLVSKLESLHNQLSQAWEVAINKAFAELGTISKSQILDGFTLTLYFSFDDEARKIEANLLSYINTELNNIRQHFKEVIQDKIGISFDNPDNQNKEKNDEIKKLGLCLDLLWRYDWDNVESVDNFSKSLDNIIQTATPLGNKWIEEQSIKDLAFFLEHPKSAPGFPKLKDRNLAWKNENTSSNILTEWRSNFNSLKFLDFLIARSRRIIENSDVYKTWRFLQVKNTQEEWLSWLEHLLTSEEEYKFDFGEYHQLENEQEGISKYRLVTKIIDRESVFGNRKYKIINTVVFQWENGDRNKRLPELKLVYKNESDPVLSAKEQIIQYLQKEFLNLLKFNSEIALFRRLFKADLINLNDLNEWRNLVYGLASTDNQRTPKLAVQTEKRQIELSKVNFAAKLNESEIIAQLGNQLISLEKHLMLDRPHSAFKVFDKVAFSNYRRLSELVFESTVTDISKKGEYKHKLGELTADTEVVLPIKIDRMTATKPNGKSTLAFDLEYNSQINEFATPAKLSGNVVVYPINLELENGKNIIIVDSITELKKKFFKDGKPQFARVLAGFLNGSGDNYANQQVKNITTNQIYELDFETLMDDDLKERKLALYVNREAGEKAYRTYADFQLFDETSGVKIKDQFRPKGIETVGATNPAGYPKLYYFLVPAECNNLVVPIQTNKYYLTKYTPYHHLSKYFKLEKEIDKLITDNEVEDLSNLPPEIKSKIEEVLKIRTKLRYYYRISSLELDLVQDLKLEINHGKAEIKPFLRAEAHMQFGNPVKTISDEELQKHDFRRFEHVISVDLGEKHLACASISKIDWEKWENKQFKEMLTKRAQTYLPLVSDFKYSTALNTEFQELKFEDEKSKEAKASAFTKFNQLISQNEFVLTDPGDDLFFEKYEKVANDYKSQQRRFGVVKSSLKNRRDELTDQAAQIIATQLVKLAEKYNACIIFENLSTGFGRKDTLQIYTEVRRLTALKMNDTGLASINDIMNWDDKSSTYELKNSGYNSDKFGFTIAAFTSKTCSNCGFVPRLSKEATKNADAFQGVEITGDWENDGKIEVKWRGETLYIFRDLEGQFELINKKGEKRDLSTEIVFSRNQQNQTQKKNLKDIYNSYFYTEKTKERRHLGETFAKFVIKTILNPRPTQENYQCPNCGHTENADYQGSFNIGKQFLTGMKILGDRSKDPKVKPADLKKGLQNIISQI